MIATKTRSLARTPMWDMTPEQRAWEGQSREQHKGKYPRQPTVSVLVRAVPPVTDDQAMTLMRSIAPQPSVRARERLRACLDGRHWIQVTVLSGDAHERTCVNGRGWIQRTALSGDARIELERLAAELGFEVRSASR